MKKNKKRTRLKLPLRIALMLIIIVILIFGVVFVYEGITRNKNNNTIYSYGIKQNVDYDVELYKNSIFETDKLESNQTYVSNVVKNINASFSYEYQNSKSIPLIYEYDVIATVIGEYVLPDEDKKSSLWSKEYVILEGIRKESNSNVIKVDDKFTIDYNEFNKIASDLKNQLKLPITSYISIDIKVKITGSVDYKSVNDTKVINLKFPLQQQAFKIKTTFDKKTFNEIKKWDKEELNDKVKREVIGFILILIAISLFIVLFKHIFNIKIDNAYNRKLNKLLKQFGEIIVEINSEVNKDNSQVIDVKTFSELLDLEDELKIPILFYEIIVDKLGEFTITHNNIVYRYILDNDKL